jgi:phage gp45-like
MADGKQISKLQRDAQQASSADEAASAQIEGRLKDLHTMMPGIIVSFDPDKQTAVVQPAIKRIFTEKGAINLPVCVDVPVAFPGGGDFFLTFPVQPGDECILGFSERAIDNWHASGGSQEPAEYRLHDLSDGIAQVGLNSQPKKLTALQMTGAELRTRSRSTYIRLEDGTIYIKGNIIHEGNNTQTGTFTQTGDTTRTGKSTTSGKITGNGGMAVTGGSGTTFSGNVDHTGGTITSLGKKIDGSHTHNETGTVTNPPNA